MFFQARRKWVAAVDSGPPRYRSPQKLQPKCCRLTMLRIPHELREEFPEAVTVIDGLIETDHDFARLAADYDDVNRAIYRIKSGGGADCR